MLGEGDPDSLKAAEGKIGEIMKAEEEAIKKAAVELSYSIDDLVTRQEKSITEDSIEPNSTIQQPNRPEKRTPICKYYARRNCMYGRAGKECNFSHPKVCPAFSKNGERRGGCTKGKGCKDFHPKVCYESMEKKQCSRGNCRFYHLNGTVSTHDDEFKTNGAMGNVGKENHYRPIRILQRNNQNSQMNRPRQSEPPLQNMSYNSERNDFINSNSNFLLMEQKIQRIESMISVILQSVRPPNLSGRLAEH